MVKTLSCAGMAALLAGAAISLGACDGGAASTAARDHTADASAETTDTHLRNFLKFVCKTVS